MTYREYLKNCDDEFERMVIIVNLVRKCPNYDKYSLSAKAKVRKELLDAEMPLMRGEQNERKAD